MQKGGGSPQVFVFVSGKNNVADIFTKVLSPDAHIKLTQSLLCSMGVLPRGE